MRRALLIGIPAFDRAEIPDLPVIRRDLELLEEILHRSGYEDVRVRGAGGDTSAREGTRNTIAYEIDRLCRSAEDGDTLFIYLSSHGVHYDGRDYLVPSDAWWRDPRDFASTLLAIDFAAYAEDSRADTVVVFIDACREGIDIGVKTVGAAPWGEGKREKAKSRHLVMCFACQPGEYARYVPGEHGFSMMARALAAVLDAGHPARTLREVCEAAQEELEALAREHDKPVQHLRTAIEMEIAGESALDRELCEGAGMGPAPSRAQNPWTEAALGAELWHREELQRCPWLPALRGAVAAIVDACWQVFSGRPDAGPESSDPWTDERVPGRVVDALGLLCLRAEPAIALNAGETALLAIAPFVHEAALWSARPEELERGVESRRRAYPHIARRAERLARRGHDGDAAAMHAWLAHKARFRLPTAALPRAVAAALGEFVPPDAGSARTVAETLRAERLFALSRCVIGEPTAVQRDDRPGSLGYEVPAGGHGPDRRIREKLCGYLLLLAGRLALDPRMLSDVLIEHLGLSDPVQPDQVRDAAARAVWRPTRTGLILAGQCGHPAIDLALRQHVNGINTDLEQIHRLVPEGRDALAPLQALPVRASADELQPAPLADGARSYELPHVSFHLSTSEVQELLMGEQLYGDPTLAIRELYQNALDACRYRQARLTYLSRTGQLDIEAHPWRGRITFRQGEHEGRPYIECHDNGIGMDRRALAECFARAGRRFHDSPEFIEEQIEWQQCEPPVEMFPNSQFGIGVFSYFMLADEIEIETCRLDRSGRPGQTHSVRIAGSGSLFRISSAAAPMADAGTRVRLYLTATAHKGRPISCYHTLRRELWVAEFLTETLEGGKRFEWRPGELTHPRLKTREILATDSPYLWWVARSAGKRDKAEAGAILADGLVVDSPRPCAVINLVGAHRPRLTVDRRRALDIDRVWLRELAAAHIEPLVGWQELDFQWMWKFAKEVSLEAAEALTQRLIQADALLPLWGWNGAIPIAKAGCIALDEKLFRQDFSSLPDWFQRYRQAAWIHAVPPHEQAPQGALSHIALVLLGLKQRDLELPDVAPELLCATPLDAVLISRNLDGKAPWIREEVPQTHIQRAAQETGLSRSEVLERLRKFEPFGLRLPADAPA